MDAYLKVKDFSFSYPKRDGKGGYTIRLDSLKMQPGSVLAVTGVSGCGKSTLLECLALLRENSSFGKYLIGDKDVKSEKTDSRRLIRSALMGYMPQSGGLIPYLSIRENLKFQIEISSRSKKRLYGECEASDELLKTSLSLFEDFDLGDVLNLYPHELSIGQRQRAVFFKSICHNPKILFIDEPTSSLDPQNGDKLISVMLEVCSKYSMCVLMVTHDLALVRKHGLSVIDYEPDDGQSGIFVYKESV